MKTRVCMEGAVFDVIADMDWVLKAWRRSLKRGTLMPLRHAGRNLLLNPRQIIYVGNAWR